MEYKAIMCKTGDFPIASTLNKVLLFHVARCKVAFTISFHFKKLSIKCTSFVVALLSMRILFLLDFCALVDIHYALQTMKGRRRKQLLAKKMNNEIADVN